MGSQTIVVPAGECRQLALNVTGLDPSKAIQKGIQSAKVIDTVLNVVKGEISDSTYLQVCEGTYEIQWTDQSCFTIEVLVKNIAPISAPTSGCITEVNEFILPGSVTTSDTGFVPITIYETNAAETVIAHGTMADDGVVTIIQSQTFAGFSQNNFPAAAYDIDTDTIYGVEKDAAGASVIFYSVDSGGVYTVLEGAVAFPAGTSIIGSAFGNDGLLYALAQNDGAAPNLGQLYTLDRNDPSAAPVLVAGFNSSGLLGSSADNVFDKESASSPGTMYYHNGAEIYKVTDVADQAGTETLLATLGSAPSSGAMTILGDFIKVVNDSNEIVLIHKDTGAITTGPTLSIPQLTAAAPLVTLVADMTEGEPDSLIVTPDRNITEVVSICCTGKTYCYLEGDTVADPALTPEQILLLQPVSSAAIDQQLVDYGTELALGNVEGHSSFTKFGRSPTMPQGPTIQDVWLGSGAYTGQPVSNVSEIVTISSDNANDTAAGTGARTVEIFGLETSASTEYTSEIITLNGTSLVDSVNSYYRINRAKILTAGSSGENEGTISIAHKVTTANVFARIATGFNQTQVAAWTVPASVEAILKRVRVSITLANGAAGSAQIHILARKPGQVYQAVRAFEVGTSSPAEYSSFGGDVFSAGTDIVVRVLDVSDANTTAEAALEFEIVQA